MKTTIDLDDEMEAALAELVVLDGSKKLAIKRSLIAEVTRRRRSQAMLDMIASWKPRTGRSTRNISIGQTPYSTVRALTDDRRADRRPVIIDAGPLIIDGERVNSRLWAIIKRAIERGDELHTTHPVLAQVWRDPPRQTNLARALRDAHLAVVAERLGTFILTSDPDDMTKLGARFETY